MTNQGTLQAGEIEIGPLGSIDASGGTLIIGGTPPLSPTNGSQHPGFSGAEHKQKSLAGNHSTGGVVYVDTLLISSGAQILADSVFFEEGGYLGGEGSFPFDVTNKGGLNPGDTLNTPGIFTIEANYSQLTNGTLFIELEGDLPGSGFDQLVITGDAQISGTLDVSALNVFEPQVGQTYEILTANIVTGTFEQIVSQGGLGFDVTYNNNNVSITITSPVDVDDEIEDLIPRAYVLYKNYPNPFNPSTTIRFELPVSSQVDLRVYNLLGQEVAVLINNEELNSGVYKYDFNASQQPSGVYFYRIVTENFIETKKMVLIK